MTDSTPQLLAGRYELRYRVGASAATEVFLARDRELDRDVAVKMLTPDRAGQPEIADRFRRMGATAAPLRDPGIVAVFDAAESDRGPFLVMEFVDGASLAETMRGGRLTVDRAAEIGAAVATALGAAHRAGTVHGSLTPRDVLIARDAGVKVTDFGAAAAGLAGITESPVEAAIYGSPERLQGGPADASNDLYALGVVLHEAVTGAPPFGGADAVAITRDKLERSPLPPSATAASVPPAFDAIIERLTSPNVARRYHTAEEAAADLERLSAPTARTATLPVVVSTATALPVEPARKSNAGWIAAVVILLLAILALVIWLLVRDDGNKEKVTVPAVVGQPVLQAQSALDAAGFRASTVNQANPTIEPGIVFAQSPPGQSLAKKGSEVKLSVSTGPPPTSTTTTTSTSTTTTSTTTSTTTTTLPPSTTTPTS